ncbi:MAG: zf-HC2 domain-containing protein [Acidobacteria bacterium]|jgi:hypothetical protein|nr:zf-HC2 domain-containing protein [Acidobacteriota bacterium]
MTTLLPDECRSARRALLTRADGDLPAAEAAALARHLAACASCRARAESLDATIAALRGLPPALPFPDDALESVWDRTLRAAPAEGATVVRLADRAVDGAARSPRRATWRLALAAAALLAAVLGPWLAFRARDDGRFAGPPGPQPATVAAALTPEERRAAAELRLVLQLTDRALQRSQRAAVDGVLRRGVDPALRRIPLLREIVPDRPTPRGAAVEAAR